MCCWDGYRVRRDVQFGDIRFVYLTASFWPALLSIRSLSLPCSPHSRRRPWPLPSAACLPSSNPTAACTLSSDTHERGQRLNVQTVNGIESEATQGDVCVVRGWRLGNYKL